MSRVCRRLAGATVVLLLTVALGIAPVHAIGTEGTDPSPPPPTPSGDTKKKPAKPAPKAKKPAKKTSAAQEEEFRAGYRAAQRLIEEHRYAAAIAALRALAHDDHPDVANYLGFASRKLGDYAAARYWYDRALAADPAHARTLSYYGMWHAEQGNLLKARDFLEQVRLACGSDGCREYLELKGVIEGTRSY